MRPSVQFHLKHYTIPLKKLFPKIKKRVKRANAKTHLKDLLYDAKLYRSIHETSYGWSKDESEVMRSLSAIQLFKLSQPTPAILSLVRAYKAKKIKYKKLRDTLRAIERFHFVFTAITSSRSSGGISAMYSAFARKLFESKDSQKASDEIKTLVDKLKARKPSIEEFKVAFNEIVFTSSNSKQKHLVRYILRNISEHNLYKYPVDFDELSVEHIQPQSSAGKSDWLEPIIGSLGNLMFLDKEMNERLADKPYYEKKRLLLESGYDFPKQIADVDDWDSAAVLKHTQQLAELAYTEVWKL